MCAVVAADTTSWIAPDAVAKAFSVKSVSAQRAEEHWENGALWGNDG